MINYSNGKIYKIFSKSDPELLYIGSTCQKLKTRFRYHLNPRNNCSSRVIIMKGDAEIQLLEEFNCNTKIELLKRETFYIRNNKCINVNLPYHTKEERYQEKIDAKRILREKNRLELEVLLRKPDH